MWIASGQEPEPAVVNGEVARIGGSWNAEVLTWCEVNKNLPVVPFITNSSFPADCSNNRQRIYYRCIQWVALNPQLTL